MSHPARHMRMLSPLLENRRLGWAMLGGGLVYFAFSLIGLRLMACPVASVTGLDCPGCGLTSGTKELISGRWREALEHHLFTPVFALFWIAVGVGLLLPEPTRSRYLQAARESERVTRWPLIFVGLIVIYTLTRNFNPG